MNLQNIISTIAAIISVTGAIFALASTTTKTITRINKLETFKNNYEPILKPIQPELESLKTLISEDDLPVGTIAAYLGISPPPGWIKCNGQDITKDPKYKELRKIVGDEVPDLQGMFLRGAGQNKDQKYHYQGGLNRQIGSKQTDQFEDHDHKHRHPFTGGGQSEGKHAEGWSDSHEKTLYTRDAEGKATSGSKGDETRPNNYAVNYIIKY